MLVSIYVNTSVAVSEFEFLSLYYIYFWIIILRKGINPIVLSAVGRFVQLFFYNWDGFCINLQNLMRH